jgi:Ca-activated chloride channel family protein
MDDMVAKGKTDDLVEAVTQVGLAFRLMTQWTSFVAVEEKVVNVDGKPQTVVQPVEMPEGVSYEGIFGESSVQDEMVGKGLQLNGGTSMFSQPSLRRNFTTRGGSVQNNQVMPAAPALVEEVDSTVDLGEPTRRVGKESRQEEMKDKEDRAKILPEIEKKEKVSVNIKAEPITFELGQSGLTEEAKKALDALAIQICQNMASLKQIVVTGHADNSAGDNYKQKLSLERATAVANYLVSHCQALTYDRIIMKGEADRTPLVSNDTEEGRAQNRRVEIRVMTY